jgi:hypothetical protein
MDYPNLKIAIAKGSIDMGALKNHSEVLHRIVSEVMPDGKFPPGKSWPRDVADRLEDFLAKEEDRKVERMQADDQRRLDEEIKRVNDLSAARARLEEWVKDAGLLNTQENAEKIDHWIRNADELGGAKGRFSVGTVDTAIAYLGKKGSNVLQWTAPPTTVTLTSPEPVVEYLPSGEVQLPIGTQPTRSHSVAQLKDLDKRERAARGPVKTGWHAAGSILS